MKILIFISIFLLLISCGKKQEIRITALNPVTGEPWPGLHYSITQEKTGAFSENYKVIHEGFLDANGKASTEVKMKNASYRIDIEDPGNTCYQNQVQYSFTKNDSNFDFTFELVSCAYLKFKLKNISCQNSSDFIKYTRLWLEVDETPTYVTLNGCYDYQGDYFSLPMGNYKYEWEVTKNGITTNFDSTFYISENEYKSFDLNY